MSEPSIPNAPFEALVEQALVGLYVIQDLRVVYANPKLGELFGYSVAELLGLASALLLVDAHERTLVEERIGRRLTGETPTSTHVMRGRRKDGELVELEVYGTTTTFAGRPAVAGTMIDVTDRRRRERELEARERRYRDLIENASDVVFTFSVDGRITSLNRAGEQFTGYSAEDAVNLHVTDFVVPGERDRVRGMFDRQVRDRRDTTSELTIVTRTGAERTVEINSRVIEQDGAAIEIQGIARDVTARREHEQALRSLTLVDDLTRLYNRRGFQTLADRHLKLAVRKKRSVFLLFADLDGLKRINDTFGHLEGDRALIDAAEALRHTFRSADIIARLGGDEFTVFPLEAEAECGDLLVSRLEEHVRAHNRVHAIRGYELSLSIGVAHLPPETSWSIDQLLEHADKALYEHKRRRRA